MSKKDEIERLRSADPYPLDGGPLPRTKRDSNVLFEEITMNTTKSSHAPVISLEDKRLRSFGVKAAAVAAAVAAGAVALATIAPSATSPAAATNVAAALQASTAYSSGEIIITTEIRQLPVAEPAAGSVEDTDGDLAEALAREDQWQKDRRAALPEQNQLVIRFDDGDTHWYKADDVVPRDPDEVAPADGELIVRSEYLIVDDVPYYGSPGREWRLFTENGEINADGAVDISSFIDSKEVDSSLLDLESYRSLTDLAVDFVEQTNDGTTAVYTGTIKADRVSDIDPESFVSRYVDTERAEEVGAVDIKLRFVVVDGAVQRFVITETGEQPGGTLDRSVTVEFTELGEPQNIEKPADDDVEVVELD